MSAKLSVGVWENDIRFATDQYSQINLEAFSFEDYGHLESKMASSPEFGQWREDCLEPLEIGLIVQVENEACGFSMVGDF